MEKKKEIAASKKEETAPFVALPQGHSPSSQLPPLMQIKDNLPLSRQIIITPNLGRKVGRKAQLGEK